MLNVKAKLNVFDSKIKILNVSYKTTTEFLDIEWIKTRSKNPITKKRLLEIYKLYVNDLQGLKFSNNFRFIYDLYPMFSTLSLRYFINYFSIPIIKKIVVSRRFAASAKGSTKQEQLLEEIALITGQHPLTTKVKKAIAGFNIRKGVTVGAYVTLRNKKMYAFLEKLIKINLPRLESFNGIARKALSANTLNIGIKDLTIFPEIPFDMQKGSGININVVGSTKNKITLFYLFTLLGLPILGEPCYKRKRAMNKI